MAKIRKVETYINNERFPYLVAEETPWETDTEKRYTNSQNVYELTKEMRMTDKAKEMLVMFVFDTGMHLICVSEISKGSANRSIMDIRGIAQTILLSNGIGCILCHNHTSGDTEPSDIDIVSTKKVKEGLSLLGITLYDHMVVGRCGYTSMAEASLI